MPRKNRPITPELWTRAEALFDRLSETSDPEAVLRAEPDAELAALARRLWEGDLQAAREGFLEETLTVVRQLSESSGPRFQVGQTLADRFTVEAGLGAGGMGEVYLAHDRMLNKKVALKTIRGELAADRAVGRRFLAEVRNAQNVTHANVCRINDLFVEGGIPFFTMEYLQGVRLSTWLGLEGVAVGTHPEALRRRIALQLAEGLAAAHRANILHCDFKPANVILTGPAGKLTAIITDFGLARAFVSGPESATETDAGAAGSHTLKGGTSGYVAPEFVAGAPASVRTDIYSFGKVMEKLLPGHRLAGQCAAERPEDRPASLDPVVRALGGGLTRRLWLAGGVAAVAGAAGSYALLNRRPIVLASRQRVAVNGFQPDGTHSAFVVRDLLLTALRQSPLLMVMADDRIRAVLRGMKRQPRLPADNHSLLALAAQESAWAIEGALRPVGAGLRLLLEVFPLGESKPALRISEQVDDARQVVKLAEYTALRLRRELGESAGSLASSVPLSRVTSAAPEAVEVYYQGIPEYDNSQPERALAFFDEALQIDPQFAMAHLYRGMALASGDDAEKAWPSYQQAFRWRDRVSKRERLWIESRYYNIIGDYTSSFETMRTLVTLYPEEATFQRHAAFAATRTGHPLDALPYNRRAVELNPDSDSNVSEWIVNHCDANLYQDALAEYRSFREAGRTADILEYGAGMAYLEMDDYDGATRAFDRLASTAEMERWGGMHRLIPLILTGKWAEASERMASDLAYAVARNEYRRATRWYWLGMLHVLMDQPWRAVPFAEQLAQLDAIPIWLQPLLEGGLLALACGQESLAEQALERLRAIEANRAEHWYSMHSSGARTLLEAAVESSRDPERADMLFTQAHGLWSDPIALYEQGRFQFSRGNFAGALATLEQLEAQRGRAFRLFFAGLIPMGRVLRARCLVKMSRFAEAFRLYERVLQEWGRNAGGYGMVRQARREFQELGAIQLRGEAKR